VDETPYRKALATPSPYADALASIRRRNLARVGIYAVTLLGTAAAFFRWGEPAAFLAIVGALVITHPVRVRCPRCQATSVRYSRCTSCGLPFGLPKRDALRERR
jgi:hypothetical protein